MPYLYKIIFKINLSCAKELIKFTMVILESLEKLLDDNYNQGKY